MLDNLKNNLFLEAYTVANFDKPHLLFTDNQTFSSTNSYTRINTTAGITYACYKEGTTIKIRQNYGNAFGYCGFMNFPSSGSILKLGAYNEKGEQAVQNVQNYITSHTDDYFFLVDMVYNSSSNAYMVTLNIYSTLQNKWIYTSNINMTMPSGYSTNQISDYCPGFIFETTNPVYIFNFRGYGYSIGKINAEDLACGKVYYIKSTKTLMAPCFNEYKSTDYTNGGHNYANTCFSRKGGVCCKGTIEQSNLNRITRIGDVKYNDIIEY